MNRHVPTLLARVFTTDQIQDIVDYVARRGAATLDDVSVVRDSPTAVPPLLAPIDLAEEVLPQAALDAWLQGLTATVIDSMAMPLGTDGFVRVLRRLGVPRSRADQLAERIAQPEGDDILFYRRLIDTTTSVGSLIPGSSQITMYGMQQLLRYLDESTSVGAMRSFELLELGRVLHEEATRATLGLSYRAASQHLGNPGAQMQQPDSDVPQADEPQQEPDEPDLLQAATTALGQLLSGEAGSPPDWEAADAAFARGDIIGWLDAYDVHTPTPYHRFAANDPEQGGRFGRRLKGALKKAGRLVKKALPMAAGMLGTSFGGPLGGKIAGGLTRAITKGAGRSGRGSSREAARLVNPDTLRAATRILAR